jgi:predicted outer membrane repeat protein
MLLMPTLALVAGFAGIMPASAAGTCDGGAGPGMPFTNNGTLTLSNCTLSGITNTTSSGGSITNTGTLTLTNVTISDSHATSGSGGAIYNNGSSAVLNLNNVTITSSSASISGGAIFNNSGTIHVNGATIGGTGSNGNRAGNSGGAIYNSSGTIDGSNLNLVGNSSTSNSGGGIYNSSATFNVTTGSIKNNTANGSGGGAYVSGGNFTASGFTVANNTATTGWGGGMYVSGNVKLDHSTVSGNSAHHDGGGFEVFGDLILTNSSVSGNTAVLGSGGGIFDSGDNVHLANDTISGNTAGTDGGGIEEECGGRLDGAVVAIALAAPRTMGTFPSTPAPNLTISGNTATRNGGGIHASTCGGTEVDLLNPTIADNKAAAGGGLWVDDFATVNYGNMLIARNTRAGGVAENCADTSSGGGHLVDIGGANLDTGNTCEVDTADVTAGIDKINVADPKLGVLADNFGPAQTQALLLGSPAIDAVPAADCPPPPTDERGMTRPQPAAGKCDTGAYECIGTAPNVTQVAPNSGPPTGGTSVTITGTNFDRPATVTFGGAPAVGVTIVSATQITATTPPGSGVAAISIQTCRAANPVSAVASFIFVTLPAAGHPGIGSAESLPWAWLLLAMLLAWPPVALALAGRRRRARS